MKEMSLTPNASPSDDKKSAAFKKLIEKGKQVGHLSTQDIDTLIVDLDLDVDELEKLNEQIDAANISIIDDFSAEALDGISLEVDLPKETDAAETVAVNDNASICLILSRVTLNTLPTSSSVFGFPSSRPNLSERTFASLGVRVFKTSASCSLRRLIEAASAGASASSSGIKSPRCESSSSPIGVSSDTGSCATLKISLTLSTGISRNSAISSGVASLPFWWRS